MFAEQNASEACRAFRNVFALFWPPHLLFPPMAPWLAGAVNRDEALEWAKEVGLSNHAEALHANPSEILHVVGLAMCGGGEFEAARKKKKKGPEKPSPGDCYERTQVCPEGNVISQLCCYPPDGGPMWCDPMCGDPPLPEDGTALPTGV